MHIDVEVLVPPVRFDIVSAPDIRARIQSHLTGPSPQLVVDLSDVEFIDSAGLAALVAGMKRARRQGGDLRLVAPVHSDAVRIFDLTCLTDVFNYVDSVDAIAGADGANSVDAAEGPLA